MTPLGVTSESQKYLILASGAVRAEGCVGNAPVCLDASPSASVYSNRMACKEVRPTPAYFPSLHLLEELSASQSKN
jgi:hypothetical protein